MRSSYFRAHPIYARAPHGTPPCACGSRTLDARIKRHLAAEKMIDRSTEEAAKTGYEAWDRATDELVALRAADDSFRKRVYAAFVRHEWSLAYVFAHASRCVTTQFKRAFPYLTTDAWRAILEQFVGELDSVFARAPPVPAPFTVFRGTKRAGVKGSWYVSDGVHGQARPHRRGDHRAAWRARDCTVHRLTVPEGGRVATSATLCFVS
jgi:hypothetical protein